jgi:ribose-phosphate pyrophosphokinase
MKSCLLSMPGNERIALAVARELGVKHAAIEQHRFPDGESSLKVGVELTGKHVAIVCTLDHPDEKIVALLFAADLARDLGAASVGLLAPYLAYMRQDMRFNAGESVTAKYFARLISMNFDWLATVDPHLHRISALTPMYAIPAVSVPAAPLIGAWIRQHVNHAALIGPDAESRQWVSEVAVHAGAPYRVLEKKRSGDRHVSISALDAEWIKQRVPVIVDDIASTAGTLIAACGAISVAGGSKPICIVVHALFAGAALAQLQAAGVERVVSCNTVVHASNAIEIDQALARAISPLLKEMAAR